jgi:serine phosphatase RsbU (regulator of sigma subunit)
MHPGEIFLAYSDGVTEPENDFGEFGEQRLIDLVRDQSRPAPARDQPDRDPGGGKLDWRQ